MFFQNSSLDDVGDVELMFPGDRFPVLPGPMLLTTGWRGGLFVRYVAATTDFTVEVSDGNGASGFLLFQSEDYTLGSPENWISHQFLAGRGGQNVATLISGGTRAFFRVFETVALAAGVRAGGPITYAPQDDLKVSENGLLCNDSDAALVLAGITTPQVVGFCSAIPAARNGNRLALDMKF